MKTIRELAINEASGARGLLQELQQELELIDLKLQQTQLKLKSEKPFGEIGAAVFDMTTAERLTRRTAKLEALIAAGYFTTEDQ